MDHVFMQSLQAEKLSALVPQFHARLPQLGCQSAGEERNEKIGKEVGEDDKLQRLQFSTRGELKRRETDEITKFNNRTEENERNRCGQVPPLARQQNTGDKNN